MPTRELVELVVDGRIVVRLTLWRDEGPMHTRLDDSLAIEDLLRLLLADLEERHPGSRYAAQLAHHVRAAARSFGWTYPAHATAEHVRLYLRGLHAKGDSERSASAKTKNNVRSMLASFFAFASARHAEASGAELDRHEAARHNPALRTDRYARIDGTPRRAWTREDARGLRGPRACLPSPGHRRRRGPG